MFDFPMVFQAPRSLLALDKPCGPLSFWGYLGTLENQPLVTQRLIEACGYGRKQGTFTIALAVALHEHGVLVEFFTESDPRPEPIKTWYYGRATELGISIKEPPELNTILSFIHADCVPILFYNTDGGRHWPPLSLSSYSKGPCIDAVFRREADTESRTSRALVGSGHFSPVPTGSPTKASRETCTTLTSSAALPSSRCTAALT